MVDVSLKKEEQNKTVNINVATTLEDKVKDLESKLEAVSKMLFLIRKDNSNMSKEALLTKNKTLGNVVNKEGLPINTFYIGYAKNSKYPYILIVNENGFYCVGDSKFKTTSEAATYVCGEPTDGFTFWQTIDGVVLKEIF